MPVSVNLCTIKTVAGKELNTKGDLLLWKNRMLQNPRLLWLGCSRMVLGMLACGMVSAKPRPVFSCRIHGLSWGIVKE